MSQALIERETEQPIENKTARNEEKTLPVAQRGHLTLLDCEGNVSRPLPILRRVPPPYREMAKTTIGRILDAGVLLLMAASALAALQCFMHL